MKLPVYYANLTPDERRKVRSLYVELQGGKCFYCKSDLAAAPPSEVRKMKINWKAFPRHFLLHPIHLQHDHDTGLTEGAIHAYCNAVLWQYHGR
jgi:hypothetical protein